MEWDESQSFSPTSQNLQIGVDELLSLADSSLLIYTLQPLIDQLSSWKTYYVRFEVTNSVGPSEKSAPLSVTLNGPPMAPRQGILTASSSSPEPITSATVSWNAPLPSLTNDIINGYIVEWWTMDKSPEIQAIRLQYTSTLENTMFSLSFTTSPILKRVTSMIPWDASESLVRRELMNLGWDQTSDQRMIDNIQVS